MYKNFYIATKNLYVKAIHRAHRKKGIETAALNVKIFHEMTEPISEHDYNDNNELI